MKLKILVVAAHPDDEVLGCGATIAKLIKHGAQAHTLILGEGVTSRDKNRDRRKRAPEIRRLKNMALEANRILGVTKTIFKDYPDNRFDGIELLDIVKSIEEVIAGIKPEAVFTHFRNDLNIDHRIVYNAVITASRPFKGQTVKSLYSFEIPSSTEWNFPLTFNPNVFFDVTDEMDIKKKALKAYAAEMKDASHPRSIDGVMNNAKRHGMNAGCGFAEAFELVRSVK